jgi:hypothetical protein
LITNVVAVGGQAFEEATAYNFTLESGFRDMGVCEMLVQIEPWTCFVPHNPSKRYSQVLEVLS